MEADFFDYLSFNYLINLIDNLATPVKEKDVKSMDGKI